MTTPPASTERASQRRGSSPDFDVLIVGAGLSGIGAAYHIQSRFPQKTYAILEGRPRLGGTWDLFRYPGIRSDSDMYTLGYSFRPWTSPAAIADGPSILEYVRSTAQMYGIDRHIRFEHRAISARWSSRDARWTVQARTGERVVELTCRFLFMCSGYYDYENGYTPEFQGVDAFRGRVVHPQKWTEDIEYAGKRVVVIGSGATAVTLVPELAKRAAHVTMLQRSPTYIMSIPEEDRIANWMRARFSDSAAYDVTRWKNIGLSMAFYNYCRRYPESAKHLLMKQTRRQLQGSGIDPDVHFKPRYNPWDERLCIVPDGDLFRALRSGTASVVTDFIDRFDERGLLLRSGARLDADLIVTATGLKLKFLGGMSLTIDDRPFEPPDHLTYKGSMCSDVPNLAVAIGYTNASWTLKCDLTCEYVCRILAHMDRHGFDTCVPTNDDPSVEPLPLLDFSSGYVQRSIQAFPRQGSKAPWRVYQNYVLDRATLRHGKLDDGALKFSRA
ncbi:MAG: NAD(P)/FAD-dependent oxidoreductase [Polyangiaceae bacterium]